MIWSIRTQKARVTQGDGDRRFARVSAIGQDREAALAGRDITWRQVAEDGNQPVSS